MTARNPLPLPGKSSKNAIHSQNMVINKPSNVRIFDKPILMRKMSVFGRIFNFGKPQAYLIFGTLLVANGLFHSVILYRYWRDPEGTKNYIANIPVRMERMFRYGSE